MTPAAKLQEYLKKRVQNSGGQYRKIRYEGRNGCPDCLIWWEWPALAFVEIKAPGDRHSTLQMRERARMDQAGVPAFVARSEADIDEIVQKVRLTG